MRDKARPHARGSGSGAGFDIFVSYRHADRPQVLPVVQALERARLKVWIDQPPESGALPAESYVQDFQSIQRSIERGLARSKTLLAWYSLGYPQSRACQWELTTAFLAGQRETDAAGRVMVINPERSNAHIRPVELQDTLYQTVPGSRKELDSLVDAIRERVSGFKARLGGIRSFARPEWYGLAAGYGSKRFTGRQRELWEIHSGLQGGAYPVITGKSRRPLVQLVGVGGSGKSVLAEEYALRFGQAYPGGIFWFRAYGHDVERPMGNEQREGERVQQLAAIAESFGLSTTGRSAVDVRAELGGKLARGEDYLWVVDDVPGEITWDVALPWLAPGQGGHTLLTTRSAFHDWAGDSVDVAELEPDAAYSLLTRRLPPADENEASEAMALAGELGWHALAIELAADYLASAGYARMRAELEDNSEDVLEFAAELFQEGRKDLPHRRGRNLSISATLLLGVNSIRGKPGLDLLRLGAQLHPAPIPRDLVIRAFAVPGGSVGDGAARADKARRLSLLAIKQAESTSLAKVSPDGRYISVHTLVSRTIRFRDCANGKTRQRELRRGAAAALAEMSPESAGLAYVEHARAITRSMADPEPGVEMDEGYARLLVRLLGRLGHFDDKLYVDLTYARDLRERAYLICRNVLGEEDVDTLMAMNDLAVLLYVRGEQPAARELEEEVLEVCRRVRGGNHRDTLTAMKNLRDSLAFSSHSDPIAAQALDKQIREIEATIAGEALLRFNPP